MNQRLTRRGGRSAARKTNGAWLGAGKCKGKPFSPDRFPSNGIGQELAQKSVWSPNIYAVPKVMGGRDRRETSRFFMAKVVFCLSHPYSPVQV